MQTLFQNLQELMVLTVDDAKYSDPKNSAAILKTAETLMNSAHDVNKMKGKAPDADPSLGIYAIILQDQTHRAHDAFKAGHKDYARSLFKNAASTCIACHSRTSTGSKLQWDFSTGFARGLPAYQQAELLAAGRSFDAALKTLETVLTDSELARKRPFDWNRALRYALAISIRSERNPDRALKVLERALNTEGAPQFVKLDAQDWIRSLKAWKAEDRSKTPATEAELYDESLRLLSLAKASQRYPMDRAGDVIYLRATATLHQMLQSAPAGEHSGDALFLLGSSYEVLRDFDLWNASETYFEACIHRVPHTQTAESCFRKYEESVTAGFTGSAGTQLPESAKRNLEKLRVLAQMPSEKKPLK